MSCAVAVIGVAVLVLADRSVDRSVRRAIHRSVEKGPGTTLLPLLFVLTFEKLMVRAVVAR